MPTLNLGRVRFNWRGEYDPLVSYLKYDVVKSDGQSFVCIADVTGAGPLDTGGSTYWDGALVRGADYNAARDEAVAAASAASTSETNAAGSASSASTSATNADASEVLADRWANEAENVEVEVGKFSAYHWSKKAEAFGDPNQFNITADQTADTRTTAQWMAAVLANQQKTNDNASNLVAVTATAFVKDDGSQPAWTAPTASALETASAIAVVVGSTIVEIPSATAITLPALTAGTDYLIYAADDGSAQAVAADSAAPAGARMVGGFHASAGASEVVESSLWDLNWRPESNPRAMVLSLDGRVWADIYLMDTQYGLNGYSRNGAQIADDNDHPIIPDAYGGNGSSTYGSMSWWVAVDLATAAGKRLPLYPEFTALAYGVVERQAVGTDPGTTQHQAGHRSSCGVEQVTGVMYQWGADIAATGGSSWRNIAEGRGDVYASNIVAPLFGAAWNGGSTAGSRASYWSRAPDFSGSSVGARAVSDHLNLQAER